MASKIQVFWLIKLVSDLMSLPKTSRDLGSGNQYFLCFFWRFFLHNFVCVTLGMYLRRYLLYFVYGLQVFPRIGNFWLFQSSCYWKQKLSFCFGTTTSVRIPQRSFPLLWYVNLVVDCEWYWDQGEVNFSWCGSMHGDSVKRMCAYFGLS